MGRIRNRIKNAVKKTVGAVKDVAKKTVEGAKNVAAKAVEVVKQGASLVKSAAKMAMMPALMVGALASGKGLDAARDLWTDGMSEFGQEFNKLIDSAMQLGVAVLDASPVGQLLNKIPGFETVKAVVVDMVASTFQSIGNVVQSAAAVVGAIGEESFKSVMSKVGDFALNMLDVASNMVPAGKIATVIANTAMAVEAGMAVKTVAVKESRDALVDTVKGLKDNPGGVAVLVVSAAAGAAAGAAVDQGSGYSSGGSSSGGQSTSGASQSSASTPPKADGEKAQKQSSGSDTENKKGADDEDTVVGDLADIGTEVGVTMAMAPPPGSGTSQPASTQFPQFAEYGGLGAADLASLLFLGSMFGSGSSISELWAEDAEPNKPKTAENDGHSPPAATVPNQPASVAV